MLKCPPLTTEWSWTCDPASLRRAAAGPASSIAAASRPAPIGSARSPGTVADAVRASIRSCKARILPTGGLQPLPVSQTFPGAWRVQLGPPAVVLMVALMGATREVGDAGRRDQQPSGGRGRIPASLGQPVLTEFAIHLAQVAVGHAIHDDVNRQKQACILSNRHVQSRAAAKDPLLPHSALRRLCQHDIGGWAREPDGFLRAVRSAM